MIIFGGISFHDVGDLACCLGGSPQKFLTLWAEIDDVVGIRAGTTSSSECVVGYPVTLTGLPFICLTLGKGTFDGYYTVILQSRKGKGNHF